MRIAPSGNWNVVGTNLQNGNKIYPFYDGFKTKKEAESICDNLSKLDRRHSYIIERQK